MTKRLECSRCNEMYDDTDVCKIADDSAGMVIKEIVCLGCAFGGNAKET